MLSGSRWVFRMLGSFPLSARVTDSNITALQKFAGARGSDRSQCFVKTDYAQELTKAVEFLGWISESGIANDPLHNAKLESATRRIKERVRSVHLNLDSPMRCGLVALSTSPLHSHSPTRHQCIRMTRKKRKPLRRGRRVMKLQTREILLNDIVFP